MALGGLSSLYTSISSLSSSTSTSISLLSSGTSTSVSSLYTSISSLSSSASTSVSSLSSGTSTSVSSLSRGTSTSVSSLYTSISSLSSRTSTSVSSLYTSISSLSNNTSTSVSSLSTAFQQINGVSLIANNTFSGNNSFTQPITAAGISFTNPSLTLTTMTDANFISMLQVPGDISCNSIYFNNQQSLSSVGGVMYGLSQLLFYTGCSITTTIFSGVTLLQVQLADLVVSGNLYCGNSFRYSYGALPTFTNQSIGYTASVSPLVSTNKNLNFGSITNIMSFTLPIGVWKVNYTIPLVASSTITLSAFSYGIIPSSATTMPSQNNLDNTLSTSMSTSSQKSFSDNKIVTVSTSTVYYLNSQPTYTGSVGALQVSNSAAGYLTYLRIA